jgi:predicted DNA binding CopG/RHH family protein
MKATKKKPKISYGNVQLTSQDFERGEFRVNMWLDLDLKEVIRAQAAQDGMKFQPLD